MALPPIVPVHGVTGGLVVPPIVPVGRPCAKMASLAELMLGSPEAIDDVLRRLRELGIIDAQSIACLAADEVGLRRAAAEILGDQFGNGAWFALLAVWRRSLACGNKWALTAATRHAVAPTSLGSSVVDHRRPVAPAAVLRPVADIPLPPMVPLPLTTSSSSTVRLCDSPAAAGARTSATLAVLTARKNLRGAAVSAASAAASSSAASCCPVSSARADHFRSWEKILRACRRLLVDFGESSPRFVELHANGPSTAAHLAVQDDVYRDKCSAPATVLGHVQALENLLQWSSSRGLSLTEIKVFDVAAFLKDQADRGPSVPLRIFRGIIWAERAFGFNLYSSSAQVRSQSSLSLTVPVASAVAALMATVKMTSDMEGLISSAPSLPLRVYAGACCCMAHGVLRWQDLQWPNRLHLTADALVGICWRMKKKRVQTPWAALRIGFSKTDWASSWVEVLSDAGLPGDDYVLRAVSRDASRFTRRIAGYNDGVCMMRTLLILSGMEADAAIKLTLHSWRHLMPTMARQLRLPENEQVEIGHWGTGSSMPRHYDSTACVTELSAKASIRSAVDDGWMVVESGCVGLPPTPGTVPCPATPGVWAKSKARRTARGSVSVGGASDCVDASAPLTKIQNFS